MSDARWQQVKALFTAAVERPPAERAAFLAGAVGHDETLRAEVEALLDADSSGGAFSGRLPVSPLSPAEDVTRTTLLGDPGSDIGPYRIVGALGAGGMGEVFRARDSKLSRDVALKMLPRAFELDPDRLARFRREAQALAALNHPHIAAIYGLEESGGRRALVLELVEGDTLAARIARGPLPVASALTIADQIARALQAAHQKGIIHRDLKPANIKVTPAGVVKVLDFGLAKTAVADVRWTADSESPRRGDDTCVGVVLGTAAYMSPEQARGQPVDPRTDIWAFGCVVFEMLAGRKAFAADATSDSTAKVLSGEPDWSALPKSTPPKVQQLLRRCLEKDASRRPQTMTEVGDLITQVIAPRRPLSRQAWLALTAAGILLIAVAAYVVSRLDRTAVVNRSEWVQLTNLDSVTQPALSPDGRMLAFIRGPNTFVSPGQLYIKVLPDGESIALTNDDLPKMGPAFSPDGSRIAYTVTAGSWDTWEVAAIRGDPRRWLKNASGLTWIGPTDLLFSEIKRGNHMAIVRSDMSRARSRDVYVPTHQNFMAHRSYASPDRRWALAVEMNEKGLWIPCRLLSMDGSSSRAVGPVNARCTNAAWSPDGRWMYFSADAGDGFHIWRQSFPNGQPEQLTSGPTEEEGVAVAPDGASIVTSVGLVQRGVWLHDGAGERQISVEGYAFGPLLSADGRRLCFRVARGTVTGQSPTELWMVDIPSGQRHRLFPGQLVTGYDVSRDDRVVASVWEADGRTRLWLAPLDGGEPPRPVPGAEGDNPRFGDGEIIFRVLEGNRGVAYRLKETGGDRQRVVDDTGSVFGSVSPDGKWVGAQSSGMSLYSTRNEPPISVFPSSQSSRIRWSPDGTRAYLSVQYGQASAFSVGRTYVLPVRKGALPDIPAGGFPTEADIAAMPGVQVLPYGDVGPGPVPSIYAYSKLTTTRNLYRIPIR